MSSTATAWAKLTSLAAAPLPAPDLGAGPVRRISAAGLTLDYSKARVDDTVLAALAALADDAQLLGRFAAMAAGDPMNFTEERAVWHMMLRDDHCPIDEISAEMERMLAFARAVHDGSFVLPSGKPVQAIVHIGIGGSYLGPRLLHEAFASRLECRFVANIDPAALVEATAGLDPATTLVVAVSKSGTTAETLANATAAMAWLAGAVPPATVPGHLAVVSANPAMARELGCAPERAFAMWDWAGGRYSVWSPVSVSVAASDPDAFKDFLAGACAMDGHVLHEGAASLPAMLAKLRLWHALAGDAQTHCVLAYQHRLRSLPAYLQQLVMESNGKSVTSTGARSAHTTSAIWWGGEGTNDQHSYYQLLLQGMRTVPTDFIIALQPRPGEDGRLHQELVANALGQSRALAAGRDLAASERELLAAGKDAAAAKALAPHLVVPGGQPSNLLLVDRLTPAALGALLAAYEHMTAALGWMWDINSFDQWGVELGKTNSRQVLAALTSGTDDGLDASTRQVLADMRAA